MYCECSMLSTALYNTGNKAMNEANSHPHGGTFQRGWEKDNEQKEQNPQGDKRDRERGENDTEAGWEQLRAAR